MLQFLPYALAAYGGYKGYKANKDAGASGINRILGAVTGATAGYYGGKGILSGGSALNLPGFGPAQAQFANMSFTKLPGINQLPFLPQNTGGQINNMGLPQIPAETGDTGIATETMKSIMQREAEQQAKPNLMQRLLMTRRRNEQGELTKDVAYKFDPFKVGTAVAVGSYLGGAFDRQPQDVYMPGYNLGVADLQRERGGFRYIDPTTGQEKEYDSLYIPEADPKNQGAFRLGNIAMDKITLREGGLAEIRKFNEGGINYLPSKVSHDENDSNNYVRASGYVEDGSGNGDKDEDTMLAQLADGEFVTRADGVLGAGIIAGANPNSMKDMREKGAQYFYEQQRRFKRIFDIIEGQNGKNSTIN